MLEEMLRLVAIKESSAGRIEPQRATVRGTELLRCPECATRYWLVVEPLNGDYRQRENGILEALRLLRQTVAAEHDLGHASARLSVPYTHIVRTVEKQNGRHSA